MDFKHGYADHKTALDNKNMFSATDGEIMDSYGQMHSAKDVEDTREGYADGLRNTLLNQMERENADSLRDAENMRKAHGENYREMIDLMKSLRVTDQEVKTARMERLRLRSEAGENTIDADDQTDIDVRLNEEEYRMGGLEEQLNRQSHQDTDTTGQGLNALSETITLIRQIKDERRQSNTRPGFFKRRALIKKGDKIVDEKVKKKEWLEHTISRKARFWNEKRQNYYEHSFRAHYKAYDMAARRYRIVTRGTAAFKNYDATVHDKQIREYRGDYDTESLEAVLSDMAENPYMALEKRIIRDKKQTGHFDNTDAAGLIKAHDKILMKSEEKDQDTGKAFRYKMRYETVSHREVTYLARRQFKKKDQETVLDDNGQHGDIGEGIKTFRDDALGLDGKLIFSQDTVEYFTAHGRKKNNTAVGIVLLGEFVSTNDLVLNDKKDIARNGTGRFTLKERGEMEKLAYAVKKSVFFEHVNSHTLQYYMGYEAQTKYARKIKDTIEEAFACKNESYREYYTELSGILDDNYIQRHTAGNDDPQTEAHSETQDSTQNEMQTDLLPNEKEAKLEKWILGEEEPDQEVLSLNNSSDIKSHYVLVKVLYDRIRYDSINNRDGVFSEDSRSKLLLDRILTLSQPMWILRKTAILLLSGNDQEDWKLACLLCSKSGFFHDSAVKKRMELASAEDGMIWRMELLDELSRERFDPLENGNTDLTIKAWQVKKEDTLSKRGKDARIQQKGDMLFRDMIGFIGADLGAIQAETGEGWIGFARSFIGLIGNIKGGDGFAAAELGAKTYNAIANAAYGDGKVDLRSYNEVNGYVSSALSMVQMSYEMFRFCQKIDMDKLDNKIRYQFFRRGLSFLTGVLSILVSLTGFSDVMNTILSNIREVLGIIDSSLRATAAHDIQSGITALTDRLDNIDKDRPEDEHYEINKAIKDRFKESSQYGFALSMTYKQQDREEVYAALDIAKHVVNIAANTAGTALGKGGKALANLGGKGVNTAIDMGGIAYDIHKDGTETREDILNKALDNKSFGLNGEAFSHMDEKLISHVLKRQTGIKNFDYLLDSTRLIMAIDAHHTIMKSFDQRETISVSSGQETAQISPERTLAFAIGKALFPEKVQKIDDLKKISPDDMASVMGFYGNRYMFTRNAIGYSKTARSLSDRRNLNGK